MVHQMLHVHKLWCVRQVRTMLAQPQSELHRKRIFESRNWTNRQMQIQYCKIIQVMLLRLLIFNGIRTVRKINWTTTDEKVSANIDGWANGHWQKLLHSGHHQSINVQRLWQSVTYTVCNHIKLSASRMSSGTVLYTKTHDTVSHLKCSPLCSLSRLFVVAVVVLFLLLICCCFCCWSLSYNAILRCRADSLRSRVILHEWIAFYSAFSNIHRSGVLTALAWPVVVVSTSEHCG